jgi:hypothetical protein
VQLPQEYISRLLVPHALLSTAYLWLTVSTCLCVYVGVLCAPAQQELETHLFEELEPCAIVAKRGSATEEGAGPVEYLVNWGDGSEETWEVRTCALACTRHAFAVNLRSMRNVSSSDMHTHAALPLLQPERNIADDVIADFEQGLEYATAVRVLDRRRGGVMEYLVEVRAHPHMAAM